MGVDYKKEGDHQIEGYFDYVVPPLEGFWWQDGVVGVDYANKDSFRWISVIRLPDFVTKEVFDWAVNEATKKKNQDYSAFIMEFVTTVYACYKELNKRVAVLGSKKVTKQVRVECFSRMPENQNNNNSVKKRTVSV